MNRRRALQREMDGIFAKMGESVRVREKMKLGNLRTGHIPLEVFKKDFENYTLEQRKDSEFIIRFYERKFQQKLDAVEIIGQGIIRRG